MGIKKIAALICAMALAACSGAGNSPSSSSNGASGAVSAAQHVDIDQIKKTVTNAQAALTDAQTALGTIFNSDGSFNWDIFLGGVNFSDLSTSTQACLKAAFPTQNVLMLTLTAPSEIATALKCILDDVVQVAGIATTDLNEATTMLNQGLAAATPGSADYTAIQSMISEIQTLQSEYNSTLQLLSGELNVVVTFLNQLPTMATSLIPVPILSMFGGMAIEMFVQPIVAEILHFQSQLQAL